MVKQKLSDAYTREDIKFHGSAFEEIKTRGGTTGGEIISINGLYTRK